MKVEGGGYFLISIFRVAVNSPAVLENRHKVCEKSCKVQNDLLRNLLMPLSVTIDTSLT